MSEYGLDFFMTIEISFVVALADGLESLVYFILKGLIMFGWKKDEFAHLKVPNPIYDRLWFIISVSCGMLIGIGYMLSYLF
jgi:hypothetical protein